MGLACKAKDIRCAQNVAFSAVMLSDHEMERFNARRFASMPNLASVAEVFDWHWMRFFALDSALKLHIQR